MNDLRGLSGLRNGTFECDDFSSLVGGFLLVAVEFKLAEFILNGLEALSLRIDNCLSVGSIARDDVTDTGIDSLSVGAILLRYCIAE